jgi:hypothetical protein
MKDGLWIWAPGLALGAATGAVLWIAMDLVVGDGTGIGLAVSAAAALGIAYMRTVAVKKRRVWRDAETNAARPTVFP